MISVNELSAFYDRNVQIVMMQAEGLTHQESLIQLPFRSNCFNWVAGHLLSNRCNILKLLGAEELRPDLDIARYDRESNPVLEDGEDVIPLEELIPLLEEAQAKLAAALEKETDETLQRSASYRDRAEQTVAYWLLFLFFHDSYHVGQTEILRQAAGTDDKII
jgi:hypothetical protein